MESAYVLVKSALVREKDVTNEILNSSIKETVNTLLVSDILVKIDTESSQEVEDITTKQIRK